MESNELRKKSFVDLLVPQGDKWTLNMLILATKHLPERITRHVPKCLYLPDGGLDWEVFRILAWVRAQQDAPDITLEEVGDRMGKADKTYTDEILKRVIFGTTSYTWEEIEADFEKDESEEPEGESPENPTEPESQDIPSETS